MTRSPALLGALLVAACTTVSVNQQSANVGAAGRPAQTPVAGRPAQPVARPAAPVRATDASLGGTVPEANRSYTGSIEMLGRTFPLPAGEWTVVSLAFSAAPIDPPNLDVALARSSNGVLTGLIAIYGTPLGRPASAGFKVNTACVATDVITADIAAENPGGAQDCLTVRFLRTNIWHDIRSNPFARNMAAALDARNIGTPQVMVGAETFVADRAHELRITGYFNPDAAGIAPDLAVQRGQSAWAPYNLPKDPAKVAYVERVKKWGEAWRPALKTLLENRSVRATGEMEALP